MFLVRIIILAVYFCTGLHIHVSCTPSWAQMMKFILLDWVFIMGFQFLKFFQHWTRECLWMMIVKVYGRKWVWPIISNYCSISWWMEEDCDKDFGTLRLQGPAIYEAGVHIFQWVHWIHSGAWDALFMFVMLCGTYLKQSYQILGLGLLLQWWIIHCWNLLQGTVLSLMAERWW